MSDPKALVKNAADPQQVEKAEKNIQLRREDELNDIRTVLSTKPGRRFIWRLLKKCKVTESIWSQSAMIHYNSGQQDIGHFIQAEIVVADENLLFQMMTENRRNEYGE